MADFKVKGNSEVFDSVKFGNGYYAGEGTGSIWTFVATGTSGQTANIYGSVDNANWVLLSTLTVGSAPDWDRIQHTFAYIRVDGTATVKASRGEA